MTTIKSALVDRLGSDEREAFSEFVKVFPLDGHEPDQQGFDKVLALGSKLDNAGVNGESIIFVSRKVDSITTQTFRFNVATILAFAKFGFEQGLKQ